MTKQINIGSTNGIDEAIAFLRSEMSKEALQLKADNIASALIGEAVEVARETYMGTGVQVSRSAPQASGLHSITAVDPEIAFIEFGAGYATVHESSGDNQFAAEAPFDVRPISYSEAHEGPLFRRDYINPGQGFWYYGGVRYTGIEPHPGMEAARQYVTDDRNIEQAVREVLSND